jgi:lipid II:glycine glycyltransferase (peptidoglycan interpeptide bridge formation enzyme)
LRAATDIQPPDTVLLDLAADEERLLSRMKPKWRYNVKLAGKKGVEIEETAVASSTDSGASAIERFYRLYELTARRDRIALHPQHYYGKLAELASLPASKADLRIWIARYEGEDLAAIITLFMDGHAVYLYGASSDRHRNLMPAYALQWAAIRAAKASGCGDYDFYGIPPTDDPGHPMSGLYRFKTGFGGIILHKAGSWDYPFHAPLYRIYRLAENGRAFWYKRVMKMSVKSVGKQGAAKARENLRESARD